MCLEHMIFFRCPFSKCKVKIRRVLKEFTRLTVGSLSITLLGKTLSLLAFVFFRLAIFKKTKKAEIIRAQTYNR